MTPLDDTALPWVVMWGYALWGECPGAATLTGVALVVGPGLFVLRRESLRGRRLVTGRGLRPTV